jgi:hypothetical protein
LTGIGRRAANTLQSAWRSRSFIRQSKKVNKVYKALHKPILILPRAIAGAKHYPRCCPVTGAALFACGPYAMAYRRYTLRHGWDRRGCTRKPTSRAVIGCGSCVRPGNCRIRGKYAAKILRHQYGRLQIRR